LRDWIHAKNLGDLKFYECIDKPQPNYNSGLFFGFLSTSGSFALLVITQPLFASFAGLLGFVLSVKYLYNRLNANNEISKQIEIEEGKRKLAELEAENKKADELLAKIDKD
jgi:hypothetical protein